MNVTPSVRAWLDNAVNSGHGYANNGFGINLNPSGAGGVGGDLSFFDSESAVAEVRPRLFVEYLPPVSSSQPFQAVLYQPTANDTSHVFSTTAQGRPDQAHRLQ